LIYVHPSLPTLMHVGSIATPLNLFFKNRSRSDRTDQAFRKEPFGINYFSYIFVIIIVI